MLSYFSNYFIHICWLLFICSFPFVKLHRESDFDEIEAWLGDGQVRKLLFSVIFLDGEIDSMGMPVPNCGFYP